MSRTPRTGIGRITIELDLSDPAQLVVWEHWQSLTRKGQASQWGREVLQGALPLLNIKRPDANRFPTDKSTTVYNPLRSTSKQLHVTDEPVYEDIE